MTAPGFIIFRSSRDTRIGVLPPGISTAPTTRSACAIAARIATGSDLTVRTFAGITSLIGIEALINLGVSMGAWPTKGLPLPFISYGGSALAMNLVAVGVLLNIAKDPV